MEDKEQDAEGKHDTSNGQNEEDDGAQVFKDATAGTLQVKKEAEDQEANEVEMNSEGEDEVKEEGSAGHDGAALAAEGVDVKQEEGEEGHAENIAILEDLLDDVQEQDDAAVWYGHNAGRKCRPDGRTRKRGGKTKKTGEK